MAFALVIASGSGRGRRFRFESEAVSIGRAPQNDLVLNDAGVSRTHARIERKAFGWILMDRASANGVELNGAAVFAPARLREGDRIVVGPVTFEFRPQRERIAGPRRWWMRRSPPARAGLVAVAVLVAGIGFLLAMRCERDIEGRRTSVGPAGASPQTPAPSGDAMPARSSDPVAARVAYERGRRKLGERRVAPRNLYDAWAAFKAAREQLGDTAGDDPLAAELARLVADCERDLRRECERLLFAAVRFERYDQQEKALQAWREMLLHYPGDDPGGCRHRAEEGLASAQPDERFE